MPDVIGVVPQGETLGAPNTTYVRPENPLLKLAHKIVPGAIEGLSALQFDPSPQHVEQDTDSEPQEAPQRPQRQEQVPTPTQDLNGNAFARLRIVERERNRERQENEALREQLSVLAKAVERSGLLAEDETYEEELPTDPISRLTLGQEQILQKFEEIQTQSQRSAEAQAQMQAEDEANSQILEFRQKADALKPGLYEEAAAHLVNVWMAEAMEDNDSLSEAEVRAQVEERINNIKMKARAARKNPGEEFMRRSVLHGFDVQAAIGSSGAKPAQSKPQAASGIARERQRADTLSSISSVQGSAASDPMRRTSTMSERDRVSTIMQFGKDSGSARRPIPLSATLAHKIRR